MVDVKLQHPDGRVQRVRKVSPVQTRRGAEAYERDLRRSLLDGSFGRKESEQAPKLAEFRSKVTQNDKRPAVEKKVGTYPKKVSHSRNTHSDPKPQYA